MSDSPTPQMGSLAWFDLTTTQAGTLRDFYRDVVGWQPEPVDMGGYADFTMCAPTGEPVAGICHARGANADLPPQWLVYIHVSNLRTSLATCERLGGTV